MVGTADEVAGVVVSLKVGCTGLDGIPPVEPPKRPPPNPSPAPMELNKLSNGEPELSVDASSDDVVAARELYVEDVVSGGDDGAVFVIVTV